MLKDTLLYKRYNQVKWYIKELIKTFSGEKSFFSSKRLERGIAFSTGEAFLVIYFIYHFKTMTYLECLALAGAAFAVAGYTLNATQKEKRIKIEADAGDQG